MTVVTASMTDAIRDVIGRLDTGKTVPQIIE